MSTAKHTAVPWRACNSKKAKGTIGRLAIQCSYPETGETGCWLFTGGDHREKGSAVSPLFDDVAEAYRWATDNRWEPCGNAAFLYAGEGKA